MKTEVIKKTQTEIILELENLGRTTGITDTSITSKIWIKGRISGIEVKTE